MDGLLLLVRADVGRAVQLRLDLMWANEGFQRLEWSDLWPELQLMVLCGALEELPCVKFWLQENAPHDGPPLPFWQVPHEFHYGQLLISWLARDEVRCELPPSLALQHGFLTSVSSGEYFRDGPLTDAAFLPLLHDEIMFSFLFQVLDHDAIRFSFFLRVWHESLLLFSRHAFQVTSHAVFQAVFPVASLQVYAPPSPMIFWYPLPSSLPQPLPPSLPSSPLAVTAYALPVFVPFSLVLPPSLACALSQPQAYESPVCSLSTNAYDLNWAWSSKAASPATQMGFAWCWDDASKDWDCSYT